jgi:hypothetical protein
LPELIVATSMADLGPLPGNVHYQQDHNTTRLYAIWTSDTPFIDNVGVNWRFDNYGGSFLPTEEDRYRDAAPDRQVYAYNPDPNSPFRQGTFRNKKWEAWTITAPAVDVQTAEIEVFTFDVSKIVMLGAAVTRNGLVVITHGPTPNTAHCRVSFEN